MAIYLNKFKTSFAGIDDWKVLKKGSKYLLKYEDGSKEELIAVRDLIFHRKELQIVYGSMDFTNRYSYMYPLGKMIKNGKAVRSISWKVDL